MSFDRATGTASTATRSDPPRADKKDPKLRHPTDIVNERNGDGRRTGHDLWSTLLRGGGKKSAGGGGFQIWANPKFPICSKTPLRLHQNEVNAAGLPRKSKVEEKRSC